MAWTMAGLCLLVHTASNAQTYTSDTLRMTLPEMEKRFLDSNLLLLASRYNVTAQEALIEQARKWDNPVLSTDQVVAAAGKLFPYGKNPDGTYAGQYFIQVEQLIKTAGKRGKLINMASSNARISELQLQDVLRNLRYQLHTGYYTLAQQMATRQIYRQQQEQLNRLLSGMLAQLQAGNIAQKDYLRMQSLQVSLTQDIAALDRDMAGIQSEMRLLLQVNTNIFLMPDSRENVQAGAADITEAETLVPTAKNNNPYFLLQQAQTLYQQQNLAYQKALRTPDITIGSSFDRNSNMAPNYVGFGVSLPIPILNRNQGNIRSAQYNLKQQETVAASAETELRNNIYEAFQKYRLALQQDNAANRAFYAGYAKIYDNMIESYRARQIGLLEFLDFFNEYTASQQRLLQQQLNLQLAREDINFHIGTDIIK